MKQPNIEISNLAKNCNEALILAILSEKLHNNLNEYILKYLTI